MKPIRLSKKKVGDLGDLRSRGQYVVAPNGIHPSGNRYTVVKDVPIARVTEKQIREAFKDYIDKNESTEFGEFKINTTKRHSPYVEKCLIPDYILNNKLKSGTGKNWKLFRYIVDILHNRSVDNSVYPQIAKTQGHSIGAIKGWVQKANEGKLAKSSCKKMREYLEHYHPELLKDLCSGCDVQQTKVDLSLEKVKLQFRTEHLPLFKIFDKITQLIGDEYLPIKKFLYRQIISAVIKQNVFEVGDYYTDRRINGIFCMKSGDGKRNIKYATKQLLSSFDFKIEEPSSIHPEQLIGKTVERKIKAKEIAEELYPSEIILERRGNSVYLMNKGYLASDVLQLEEAKELFTSRDAIYKESREKLCIGLDPFGRNEVSKRSVDNLESERVKYFPTCVAQVFLQPYKLPEQIVTEGTLRRFLTPFTDLNNLDKQYEAKWDRKTNLQECIIQFVEYLKQIREINKFEFSKESIVKLKEYHQVLIDYGRSYSEKGFNFTNIEDWTLGEWLIKFSVNVAASLLSPQIKPEHVDLAFMDLLEVWVTTLKFIETKVWGQLDYGEGYKGCNLTERKILDFLLTKEATSYESSDVSIAEFLKEIMKLKQTDSESTARTAYLRLKEHKLVDSKQEQHSSKVWITFEPIKFQGYKGSKGYEQYNLICSNINHIISTLMGQNPCNPYNPEIEEEEVKDD